MIEGNRLTPDQIEQVMKHAEHFVGREREEKEVKGYYAALQQVEHWTNRNVPLTEKLIQQLHALVMSNGKIKAKPTAYRDGQNVIRDSQTKAIVYMPPTAEDVPTLMKGLVTWIHANSDVPCPIVAAIAHYQFATIHPYYDGNGRTARLLTTFLLHQGGYDLKGLYSLEEYYAENLSGYYRAISVGPSHNYYLGRAEADITPWIEYFSEGMAYSFESVFHRMSFAEQQGEQDQSSLLRKIDPKQRKALELFRTSETITARQIGELFGFQPRTAAQLCQNWVQEGFLEIANPSNKARKYRLATQYEQAIRK